MKQFFLLMTGLLPLGVFAQQVTTSKETPAETRQLVTRPTIMVFPFFKEGEDIRKLVESDVNNRVVITKVKEAFDSRGYSTVDFLSKVRNLQTNDALTSDKQTDVKTAIIQSSNTDICVEVEYDFEKGSSGNRLKVILTAYESSASASLANKIGFSRRMYSEDVSKLASDAVETVVADFLNVMQEKFNDIVENGKYMALEFNLNSDSGVNMSSEAGKDNLPLSDVLEEWVGNNSKSYHIQGVTDAKVLFDVVRVPRMDAQGKSLTSTRYGLEILKFCNSLAVGSKKLKVERLIKGNTIYVSFK
ncbi:hypothetical protein GO755_21955 [Spirosoma sp. HMF4905]|uniref:Uncharacterized protein n=1 Tax=Spirosoma arboris TaxID=2682092 RepID=A0A7K1SG14_9BACT|nr:DUF6175 family protein [Spirosoma arboris]MVM32721.1 hypothetical protein [Spirosoma arboris]